jgi:hypothetical protein
MKELNERDAEIRHLQSSLVREFWISLFRLCSHHGL